MTGARRVAVTGGRHYDNWSVVAAALATLPPDTILVHGGADGADTLADMWWRATRTTDPERHPARWRGPCHPQCNPGHRRRRTDGTTFCPAAGVYRNQEMVDTGLDLLVAFPGGNGTADMIHRCRTGHVPVWRPLEDAPPPWLHTGPAYGGSASSDAAGGS